jgi:hypothetical protein
MTAAALREGFTGPLFIRVTTSRSTPKYAADPNAD